MNQKKRALIGFMVIQRRLVTNANLIYNLTLVFTQQTRMEQKW